MRRILIPVLIGGWLISCGGDDSTNPPAENVPDASAGGADAGFGGGAGASAGGSAGSSTGGTTQDGGADASQGGAAGTAQGGMAGNAQGGTAGSMAGAGGSAGVGGAAGGDASAPMSDETLCAEYCKHPNTDGCNTQGASCMSNCLASVKACTAMRTLHECLLENNEALCYQAPPLAACAALLGPAQACADETLSLCAQYCDKAISAAGCASLDCFQTCADDTDPAAACHAQYFAYYSCVTWNYGKAACTHIDPPAYGCDTQTNALNTCTGAGGSGGTGGAAGAGGSSGAAGSSGAGGSGCTAPSDPTLLGCSQPDGNIKLSGNTPMVAVTYANSVAPASCTAGNSKLYTPQGGTVNIGVPATPGCSFHRVCNYDASCTGKYSPGKVLSRCFNGTSVSCVTQ